MLYSCARMATVDVRGLRVFDWATTWVISGEDVTAKTEGLYERSFYRL